MSRNNQVLWRYIQPLAGINGVMPDIDSTRISKHLLNVVNTTSIVYTVPASKTFYMTNAWVSSGSAAAALSGCYLFIRNASDVTTVILMDTYAIANAPVAYSCNYMPALELPAGYDLCLLSSQGNEYISGGGHGWLEDV